MGAPAVFQHVVHGRHVAVSVSDALARALRIRGEFPPLVGDIACEIVSQTAPVVRTFTPALVLSSFRNASGFLVIDGWYRSHADGRELPLASGTYVAKVRGSYYQDLELALTWPPPEGETRVPPPPQAHLELLPGPTYPMPDVTASRFQLAPTILRGTLTTPSGEPIEGGRVEIVNLPPFLAPPELPALVLADWPFVRAVTNATGDWALVLPSRRYLDNAPEILAPNTVVSLNLTLRLTYPSGVTVDLQRNVILGREFSLRATALRGQIVAGGGRPVAGATISTSVNGLTSVSRANGLWFLYFDFDQADVNGVTVTATTPGGATAVDPTVQVKHEATIVVPTFHFS